jgi:hypothetical protein
MYPRVLLLYLFAILSISQLHAQFKCGFDEITRSLSAKDPNYKRSINQLNKNLRDYIVAKRAEVSAKETDIEATIYYIPVVVHVIHTDGAVGTSYNPDVSQIASAINYLNAVYDGTWTGAGGPILGAGDLQIKFVLATKDPNNNPTSGINRIDGSAIPNYASLGVNAQNATGADELSVKNLSRWDPFKYYNIWLVNKIDGCDGLTGCPSFIAGYAYFPFGDAAATTRDNDGTIMLASQMKPGQKTLPHEVGHALGLYHPFQGETDQAGPNICPPNTPTGGDECADTNPVTNPFDDGEASPFACRTGTNSCTGLAYNDNTEKNYMNYTNCYQLFSNDQKARMQAAAVTSMRASLATSWANNQGAYPTTWSVPSASSVTPTSLNKNSNVAGILSISLNGTKVYSLNATQDAGYLNNASKWYNLFQLQKSTTYTMEIGLVGSGNKEQVGVWIDYNGDGVFNNTNEQVFYLNNIPATSGISFSFTTPSSLSGSIVRMRVMEDLWSSYTGGAVFNNSSTTLSWGQAEDYPVFLRATTLPVTLLEFTGAKGSNLVNLSWKTAQEIGIKEYQVERSLNGADFSAIGTIRAKGSNIETAYKFTDNSIKADNYYYRLKSVDYNGSFTYSKIISFSFNTTTKLQVMGNPFRDKIKLILPANAGKITCRLMDAAGRLLYSKTMNQNNQSSVELSFANQNLSAGIYILETVTASEKITTKLVKE